VKLTFLLFTVTDEERERINIVTKKFGCCWNVELGGVWRLKGITDHQLQESLCFASSLLLRTSRNRVEKRIFQHLI